MQEKERLIVILGPTAVGKTDLSIELAKELDTEIISGDSMLFYKGFDIGSAKPTVAERQGIVHHLVDNLEPWENFNVTDFVREAQSLITKLNQQGEIPIIAGGTGLYIKALLEGYEFNETADHSDFRQEMTALAEEKGKEYVHDLLTAADPQAAAEIHANNLRRVIRALEVARFGGEQISRQKEYGEGELCYDVYVAGLNRERQGLYARINQRVELMFAAGLETEVRQLLAGGVTRDMQAMQGIGYKETAAWLNGEMTKEEAVDLIQKSTRHFAKRQLTWYRKMPYIHWYMADEMSAEKLLDSVTADVRHYFAPEK
ncbi:putative tRNA delta(2)-isopentenylpyrophosphate transferase [Selenomonas ruminantium subsp. lactilytica TAM6421]|uniref:tRNA dimethylallyltransferase n=1 Tax=Selenomonas ruminantium subsp. lactilytica (strain NBRC 103574 / TAM6421) TaxID=927704 RepID=I0GPI3_SELRL|nr:tRNA (adenosine(37)-N6)-dimethylallyltransferase MiaA [Selenomonas ruminantium]BAL82670.1 putative tRNA delta(2)-isopentenylpyrophosphate transferase [Selenomonas ruminantium subsp. lactilytica TAM6421]